MSRIDQLKTNIVQLSETIATLRAKKAAAYNVPVGAGATHTLVTTLHALWKSKFPSTGTAGALQKQLETLVIIATQFIKHEESTSTLKPSAVAHISDQLKAIGENLNGQVDKHLGHGDINGLKTLAAYRHLHETCKELSPSSSLDAGPGDRLIP
ncbi:MAG: hypothetical protein P1U63_00060 [Coxiellaceae bacterium]|nr:hypothetical protein [Coxiellaceae bacterium]